MEKKVRIFTSRNMPDDLARRNGLLKLVSNVEVNERGCWVWQGFCCPEWGYGFTSYRNRSMRTHLVMWKILRGDIPKGMVIRHNCDNPPCINPDHLQIGTVRDNVHDRLKRGRDYKSNRTHCPMGHEYAGQHLQLDSKGYRHCRTCSRIKQRIRAGWPPELARTLPVVPHGHRVHTPG